MVAVEEAMGWTQVIAATEVVVMVVIVVVMAANPVVEGAALAIAAVIISLARWGRLKIRAQSACNKCRSDHEIVVCNKFGT